LISAKFALERPQLIDRLLLMNPMFGLKTNVVQPILKLMSGQGIRLGESLLGDFSCDNNRGTNQGGYCQFMASHVLAMADFAQSVLCRQWGLAEACKYYSIQYVSWGAAFVAAPLPLGPVAMYALEQLGVDLGQWVGKSLVDDSKKAEAIRKDFGKLAQFQIVTTYMDPFIDNQRIEKVVSEMLKQQWGTEEHSTSLCYWPHELTHGYIYYPSPSSPRYAYHDYIISALVGFLARGKHVQIVRQEVSVSQSDFLGDNGWCLENQAQVKGSGLTVLPQTLSQPSAGYELMSLDERRLHLDILYQGFATITESFNLFAQWRKVEILQLHDPASTFMLALRNYDTFSGSSLVPDVFTLRPPASKQSSGSCVQVHLLKLNNGIPLLDQVLGKQDKPIAYTFCESLRFVQKICKHLGCHRP
jgi:hypothetical protein